MAGHPQVQFPPCALLEIADVGEAIEPTQAISGNCNAIVPNCAAIIISQNRFWSSLADKLVLSKAYQGNIVNLAVIRTAWPTKT